MKGRYLLIILLFTTTNIFAQNKAEGTWLGSLNAGSALRVIFHINNEKDGQLHATMDSPDQGAKGISFSSVQINGDSIILKMEMIKGGFSGIFKTDTIIEGTWKQGGKTIPLMLRKTMKIDELKRPQTPKPPFSYVSKDVEYDNADKTVHLGATITFPATGSKFPAAILISGSGQQDRDESIFEHKPFAVIADYLTNQGFAILRVDDRGKGQSKGDLISATSADFAKDVETSLAFLKTQPQIDTTKIGLIGHSEGGLIAAIVGSLHKEISFMVLLASPGENGASLLAEQNEALLRSGGLDSLTADSYKKLFLEQALAIVNANDQSAAYSNAQMIYQTWKSKVSSKTIEALGFGSDSAAISDIRGKVKGFNSPWMKYFVKSDASKLFAKTAAKVLALNGSKDIQVIPTSNINGIQMALKKSKSKSYKTIIIPGLNHLFQHCKTCTINEYGQLEETISPEVLGIMGNWLKEEIQ